MAEHSRILFLDHVTIQDDLRLTGSCVSHSHSGVQAEGGSAFYNI